jgi:hypothetical protein
MTQRRELALGKQIPEFGENLNDTTENSFFRVVWSGKPGQ